ncbi:MAG: cation diffusion facilitator family transporter, partial [Lachnospiraceae bacterium]|nr:cation diffusion facilitator family transporter [Lachnospiraceae bacterium]
SVKKIIHPEDVNYSIVSLIILGAAIVVKLVLGAYTKAKGRKVNSGSLVASGQDAFQDAVLSASVLVSAVVYLIWGIKLEAYVGAIIGLFIIKAGIEMILEAVNEMLGKRADAELSKGIKATIAKEDEVHGVYDLFINNYGPDKNVASVHVEVDDSMTAHDIDTLTRKLQAKVYKEHGVVLQAVGVYSVNTGDNEAAHIHQDIRRRVLAHEDVLQMHGFYIDTETKQITFDIILDFSVKDRSARCAEIKKEIEAAYPDYNLFIALDVDLTD